MINGILEKLETHPAVIPAIAVEDTIKKYGDGKIEWTLERENYGALKLRKALFTRIFLTHTMLSKIWILLTMRR